MKYQFQWKRKFFWNTRTVVGHNYVPEQDKMVLFFENGAQEIIANFRNCHQKLGTDWVLAMQKNMEQEAGQAIPLKVAGDGK